MPTDAAIPFPNPNPGSQRNTAASLFLEGHVVEASTMLANAILQGESADLWNDWGVVQLGVAERALRRALLLAPTHHDAAINLGVLLFSVGKHADAAVYLRQSLSFTTGPTHDYAQDLLNLCDLQRALPAAPPPRQISEGYTFTADWFSGNIASFWKHLKTLRGTPCSILEIGCFEGRASTWLLQNIATSPDSACSALIATPSRCSGQTSRKPEAKNAPRSGAAYHAKPCAPCRSPPTISFTLMAHTPPSTSWKTPS